MHPKIANMVNFMVGIFCQVFKNQGRTLQSCFPWPIHLPFRRVPLCVAGARSQVSWMLSPSRFLHGPQSSCFLPQALLSLRPGDSFLPSSPSSHPKHSVPYLLSGCHIVVCEPLYTLLNFLLLKILLPSKFSSLSFTCQQPSGTWTHGLFCLPRSPRLICPLRVGLVGRSVY